MGDAATPIRACIFDLDGTVLDTESLVVEVGSKVLAKYGKALTVEALHAGTGKRPVEAWQAVVDVLGLDVPAEQLYKESEPLLQAMWQDARCLPGVRRLLTHLSALGLPLALATSTPRDTLRRKMLNYPHLHAMFQSTKCGDEVENGKPAPDCFLQVAAELGVDPSECLVFEDAPSGVEAAAAAGMRVVAIPSLMDKNYYPLPQPAAAHGCVAVLPSLLEFRPEEFGLPPFNDRIGESIALDPPICLKGPVVKGFGRGSKELGIRTANLDAKSLAGSLAEAVTGIFFGWASVGNIPGAYKMVMSVGFNPFYSNKEKTAEPWILHKFEQDFYGQELRLLVCGYIRPEASFDSVQDLVDRIHKDAEEARCALEHPRLAAFQGDPFLLPPSAQDAR